MARIAVIKGDKPDDTSEAYATVAGLREINRDDYTLIRYSELLYEISDAGVSIAYQSGDLKDFDLVYIRDFQGYEFERNAIAQYLKQYSRKFLNSDIKNFQHISKLTQYITFAFNNVPIPYTLFGKNDVLIKGVLGRLSFPIILKSITGNSGADNFLIHNEAELRETLKTHAQVKFVAQEYVPNDGDLRIIVLGDKVECVYSRLHKAGDHRNNVSQGGDKQYLSLNEVADEYKQLAIRAAAAVEREICGVDLMINSATQAPIILEANFNFGIRAVPGTLSDELYGLSEYLHVKASE